MKILLVAPLLLPSAPTAPDTFAMACSGDILRTAPEFGGDVSEKFELPDQIFVFSESENTVLRAMPRRHEFERVCDIDASGTQTEFSPQFVRVSWQSAADWEARTSCKFEFDRETVKATMWQRLEWSKTRWSETQWRMKCSPTPVPVYDEEPQ